VAIDLRGPRPTGVSGRILTAETMNALNTFEKPDVVKPSDFSGAKLSGNGLELVLPAKSVVALELN
jgi:alpha-N-arabinofuranosidase